MFVGVMPSSILWKYEDDVIISSDPEFLPTNYQKKNSSFLPSFDILVESFHPCYRWHVLLSCSTVQVHQIVILMDCQKFQSANDITKYSNKQEKKWRN